MILSTSSILLDNLGCPLQVINLDLPHILPLAAPSLVGHCGHPDLLSYRRVFKSMPTDTVI
jgi:hypothetical protein